MIFIFVILQEEGEREAVTYPQELHRDREYSVAPALSSTRILPIIQSQEKPVWEEHEVPNYHNTRIPHVVSIRLSRSETTTLSAFCEKVGKRGD